MIDPVLLRTSMDVVRAGLARRGVELDVAAYEALEAERKQLQVRTQELQALRNSRSKAIGIAKGKGEDASALMAEVAGLGEELRDGEAKLADVQQRINEFALGLPNVPHASVPDGRDETANVEVRRWGAPPAFDFTPRDHVELGERLHGMDFETAAKIASARFVILSGALARMQRALIQFMLDLHTREHGYTEVYVPYMVNADSMLGTGQLPKFAADLFAIPEQGFYLIPTAEVPVTNIARDHIFAAEEMPRRFVCHSPCFRSEAGSHGRDTRGMIRQHQFQKVELVSITTPEQSEAEHERMVSCAEAVLKALELPFRTVLLCSGDMGFSARKTYDLEVWLPSEGRYREISSCSNCGDFQARRMDARAKKAGEKGTRFVHTLNGSGLAVGRALVAVMENYQDENGRIAIPQALHPYLPGMTHIGGGR